MRSDPKMPSACDELSALFWAWWDENEADVLQYAEWRKKGQTPLKERFELHVPEISYLSFLMWQTVQREKRRSRSKHQVPKKRRDEIYRKKAIELRQRSIVRLAMRRANAAADRAKLLSKVRD